MSGAEILILGKALLGFGVPIGFCALELYRLRKMRRRQPMPEDGRECAAGLARQEPQAPGAAASKATMDATEGDAAWRMPTAPQ